MPENQPPLESQPSVPESNFMLAAERQVDILVAAATRVPKLQIRVLGAVCAALLVISGVLGYLVSQQYSTTQELRRDAVVNCQSGNEFKADQTRIWNELISITPAPKDAKGRAFISNFRAFVEHVNAPKNCAQAYNVKASGK
jgi:hypothetical protein